jgi:monovalent cation:H+ antiporter-2, CPA2 family
MAFTTLGMIPLGELNFALAQVGVQERALSTDMYNLILTSALVTIVLTPAAFNLAPTLAESLTKVGWLRGFFDGGRGIEREAAQLEQHAIVIGYGRVGQCVARGLREAGLTVAVIDVRLSRVREGVADGWPSICGNAFSATVLEAAQIGGARLVVIALPDFGPARAAIVQVRTMNPNLAIAARAEHPSNERALLAAGAHLVVVPELAGAMALLKGALDRLQD